MCFNFLFAKSLLAGKDVAGLLLSYRLSGSDFRAQTFGRTEREKRRYRSSVKEAISGVPEQRKRSKAAEHRSSVKEASRKKIRTSVNSLILKLATISSQSVISIIGRLKKALGIQKDVELARFFNVAQNTISAWKKRNSMNYDLLFKKCATYNIDLNWLIYGEEAESRRMTGHGEKVSEKPAGFESSAGQIRKSGEREESAFNEKIRKFNPCQVKPEKMEAHVLEFIKVINKLPWPLPTKRKILETYIKIIYQELSEKG